ncbi:MAG: KAP P-loop domain-containing protein [Halanaerobium sp. T82-1]|nr:MAG: KAP P-loop domain-containing protein [Halanaerobium sp. T82-1]
MEYLKNINESIKRYLEIDKTDYAILINGSWGSGKTYYFQNNIEKIIDRIEDKDYKYIYISLYGINNLEEINQSIIWQAATNKEGFKPKAKFFGGKFASFASSVVSNRLGATENPIKDLIDQISEINLDDVVLCFDDLERSHITPNKIFGYINDFVEHQNIKTFVIGHEKKLEEIFIKENIENKWDIALNWIDLNKAKDGKKVSKKDINKEIKDIFSEYNFYKQIKEKLIGKTIDFRPKDGYYETIVLDNIISNFEDDNYKKFILKNKTEIIKIFKSNKYNIRSLKHALDDFYIIHEEVEGKISSDFLNKIFYFALICTFENKNPKVEIEEIKKVTYDDVYTSYLFESDEVSEDVQVFYTKYFDKGIEFEKINSIVDYIITGYLNIDLFNEEISYLKEQKSKTTLDLMQQFWKLSDQKFEESLSLLTQELKDGEYRLSTFPQVYKIYATLHNMELLDLNFEELKELFIDSIDKSIEKNSSEDFIESSFIPGERISQKYNDFYKELKKIIKNKNQELKKVEDKEKIDNILNSNHVYDGLRDFIRKTNNIRDFHLYVDNEKLVVKLKELCNEDLNNIVNLIVHKTKEIEIDDKIKTKLIKLKELIYAKFDFDDKKLSTATIKRLYDKIEKMV